MRLVICMSILCCEQCVHYEHKPKTCDENKMKEKKHTANEQNKTKITQSTNVQKMSMRELKYYTGPKMTKA